LRLDHNFVASIREFKEGLQDVWRLRPSVILKDEEKGIDEIGVDKLR
jgi:hypothetical protein